MKRLEKGRRASWVYGGGSDRIGFGKREMIEGCLKVIKYQTEYHPKGKERLVI